MQNMRIKRSCKGFGIKNFGECYDLYVQSDTLLLADVFENFRNMCLNICELDPAKKFSAPGLAWQVALKKIKIKADLLTDINMLSVVEKTYWRRNMSLYLSICKSL